MQETPNQWTLVFKPQDHLQLVADESDFFFPGAF